MRPFLVGFIFVLLLVVSMAMFAFSVNKTSGEVIKAVNEGTVRHVDLTVNGFEPQVLYIKRGDTIIFTNYDYALHSIRSEYWGSDLIDYLDTYELTYTTEWSTNYKSMTNPNFTGRIVVLD